MHRSLRDHMNDLGDEKPTHYNSACAAAGQLALMSLYDTMFSTCDIQGRKRERNSQLQRLISRPFSTRFG